MMIGSQPEHRAQTALERVTGGERGRTGGLGPRHAEIRRPKHRRPEMAGTRREQQRPTVARVKHRVLNDVAEELRPGAPPFGATGIGREHPQALPRPHEENRSV